VIRIGNVSIATSLAIENIPNANHVVIDFFSITTHLWIWVVQLTVD
jgi:hypothetical protein